MFVIKYGNVKSVFDYNILTTQRSADTWRCHGLKGIHRTSKRYGMSFRMQTLMISTRHNNWLRTHYKSRIENSDYKLLFNTKTFENNFVYICI